MWMCGDIFAAARLWRGRLLTTGRLSVADTQLSCELDVSGGSRWKRGDVETKLNTVNMTVWVHKECNCIEEEAITKLQEAWDRLEQKDECTVRLNDLEGAYWRCGDRPIRGLRIPRSDAGCGRIV